MTMTSTPVVATLAFPGIHRAPPKHENTTATNDTVASSDVGSSFHSRHSDLSANMPEDVHDAAEDADAAEGDRDAVSLLADADRLADQEQLLAAARLINRIQDPSSSLSEKYLSMLKLASDCQEAFADLVIDPETDTGEGGWKRQGESHGKYDIVVYHKVDDAARLSCRIETPIDQSLLVPLLAVLNEVDLYPEWIPSFTMPKLGIQKAATLEKLGRASQILTVLSYLPWPFHPREAVMQVTAVDEIEQANYLGIRMHTIKTGDSSCVPPPEPNVDRMDFDGAFLFRACPADPTSTTTKNSSTRGDDDGSSKPKILISFKMNVDAHLKAIPKTLINYVTKTVIGRIWGMLLQVAEAVRDGARPHHQERIESQTEFFDWVRSRIDLLFERMEKENELEKR